MVFFFTLKIHSISGESSELEYFLGKDIQILLSKYMHIQIAKKVDSNKIIGISKFLDPGIFKYNGNSYITRKNSGYQIKINNSKICKNGLDIILCKEGCDIWDIKEKNFGFNILQNGKCMTAVSKDLIKLKPCTNQDSQLFIFSIAVEPTKFMHENFKILDKQAKDELKILGIQTHSSTEGFQLPNKRMNKNNKHYSTSIAKNSSEYIPSKRTCLRKGVLNSLSTELSEPENSYSNEVTRDRKYNEYIREGVEDTNKFLFG